MNGKKKSPFIFSLKAGTITALVSILFFMLGKWLDILGDTIWLITLLGLITLVTIVQVIRFRDHQQKGLLTFRSAFNLSYLIVFFSIVFTSVFSAIYQSYISPETGKKILAKAEQKLLDDGKDLKVIQSEMYLRKLMLEKPVYYIAFGVINALFVGAVISLIVAPVSKKDAAPSQFKEE